MSIKQLMIMTALTTTSLISAQDKPVWELGKNKIDSQPAKGNVELSKGVMKLDCVNTFKIPSSVLGAQKDYTIEFEFRRSPKFKNLPRMQGALNIISNADKKNHTGFALIYLPPKWDPNGGVSNRIGVDINGYWNGEIAGLVGKKFNKISFVVKDGIASIYRNGLLISMTGEIKPSDLPLTIGGAGGRGARRSNKNTGEPIPEPYEFRNLKIFNKTIVPTGYDKSTEIMRNVSGEGYQIQRAIIKDKSLPRILVIGDSISMGYRRYITNHFKGKAYVDYWVGPTVPWGRSKVKFENGPFAQAWKGVLSNGPYDVISWNPMTLHWWHRKLLTRCPDEAFLSKTLTEAAQFLKKEAPNSQLLWIRCTPIRKCHEDGSQTFDESPTCNPRIIKYNKTADAVMKKEGIPIVDLYSIAEQRMPKVPKGWKDIVHWKPDTSKLFAKAIIKEIEKHIPKKK